MPLQKTFSRLHRWLAAIVGVQILIWFASGTIMAVLPIETVRGEHLLKEAKPQLVDTALLAQRLPALVADLPANPEKLTAVMLGNKPVLQVRFAGEDAALLLDVRSGKTLSPLPAEEAMALVRSRATVDSSRLTATKVLQTSTEYKGEVPAWRIDVNDDSNTAFYVSMTTGDIKPVRTRLWRVYDFLWGLHIMDWNMRENFNTPWLIGFAGLSFVTALAGTGLLFFRLVRPWWRRRRKRSA
jgi:hypothetical protein